MVTGASDLGKSKMAGKKKVNDRLSNMNNRFPEF